jgi:hypothetical protein
VRGPVPVAEWRIYRCMTDLGMSLAEVDAAPAQLLDMLLAIHDVVRRVQAEKADE